MKTLRYILYSVIYAVLFVLIVGQTAIAQNGATILAKIDSVQNAFSDMVATQRMVISQDNGSQRKREILIKQMGSELRMVQFIKPADVQGVGFLRISADRQYLYLPAFRKVRRIASSAKNENFMGTDFSYEDMSQSTYSEEYEARTLEKSVDGYKLELYPKPGADETYAKLVVQVSSSNFVIQKIEYFDANGRQLKELTISNIENIDGYWMGKSMVMKTLKENSETRLTLSDIRFDQGLKESDFSERMLKRPIR